MTTGALSAEHHPTHLSALPIAEVAQATGLSAHTLRYYERAGLVRSVRRSAGGQRRYAPEDLEWLSFLLRLRVTGMSIAGMQEFAALRRAGPRTVAQRLELLRGHAEAVQGRVEEMQAALRHLDVKITHYRGILQHAGQEDPS